MARKAKGTYKRRTYKKWARKYLRGAIDFGLALTTLAGNTVVSAVTSGVLLEKAFLTSVKALYTLDNLTISTDDGPIMVGLAHSDYSSAEIEEWIESLTGSWDVGDLISQEISQRKIRQIGVFISRGSGGAGSIDALNEGKEILTKCNWQLQTGDGVRFWAYNMGSSALATTVPNFRVQGKANLWPN